MRFPLGSRWLPIFLLALLTCANIHLVHGQTIDTLKAAFAQVDEAHKKGWLNTRIQNPSQSPSEVAWMWHQMGNLYFKIADLDSAIYCTEQALNIRSEIEDNDGQLASTFNLGLYHAQNQSFSKSNAYYKSLLNPVNRKTGVAYFQLGRNFLKQNDISQASDCFEQAKSLPPFSDSPGLKHHIQLELTEFLLKTRFTEHLDSAEVYLTDMRTNAGSGLPAQTHVLVLNRLGLLHSYRNALDSALWYWKKADSINDQCCNDPQMRSDLATNRAIVKRKMNLPEESKRLHFKAWNSLPSEAGSLDSAIILDNIARSYMDVDSLKKAEFYSNNALNILDLSDPTTSHGIDTVKIWSFPYKYELVQILTERADLCRLKEQNDHSFEILSLCAELVNDLALRTSKVSEQMKLRALGLRVYSQILDYHLKNEDLIGLLGAIEASKSVVLKWHAPDEQTEELKALKNELVRLETRAFEDEIELDISKVLELRTQIQKFNNHSTKSLQNVDHLLSQLDENKDYLVFSTDQDRCIIVHVRKDEIIKYKTLDAPSLSDKVRNFSRACEDRTYAERIDVLKLLGRQLYEQLLNPFDLSQNGLVIIPDGFIHVLPFGALINDQNEYAFFSKPVSFATSLSHAVSKTDRAIHRIACIYPTFYEHDKLKSVAKEITSIKNSFSTVDIEYDSSIISELIHPDIDAIHFGSHGGVGKSDPEYGYIYVGEDKRLYLREIWGQKFNKSLVVVGACESGKGEVFESEGQLSIGEAFVSGGCPNVLSAKWKLDDHASGEILSYFYNSLGNGQSPSASLNSAISTYYNEANPLLQDPYYWAGWTVYEGKISEPSIGVINWIGMLILIVSIISLLGIIFKPSFLTP